MDSGSVGTTWRVTHGRGTSSTTSSGSGGAGPTEGERSDRRPLPVRLRRQQTVVAAAAARLEPGAWARIAGVASAPLVAVWRGSDLPIAVYLVLGVWVALSARRIANPWVVATDVAIAVGLTATEGGLISPFLLFVMVVVTLTGARHGAVTGATAGLLITLGMFPSLILEERLEGMSADVLLPLLALLPLTGVTAALAVHVFRTERSGRAALQEANRLLVSLRRVADEIPGGLDIATITAAALAEVRAATGTVAAVVYTGSGDVFFPAANIGHATPPAPVHAQQILQLVGRDRMRLVAGATLRGTLGTTCAGHPFWSVVPLRARGGIVGAILVAHHDLSGPRRAREALVTLADDTALALDNAQLFDGAAARAADAARRRIAHDLHDSVAQSLTHLKMELELFAMDLDAEVAMRGELDRLSRVAGRALEDVRATIAGLRTSVADDGIVDALRRHVEDLGKLSGTTVTFEATAEADIDPELRPDVLRVAQEAISNAVQHAAAHSISVSLEIDEDVVSLVVEDDGRGIPTRTQPRPGHGVGLRAMHDRATAVGGALTIRDRVGGGTVVSLVCPSQARRHGGRVSDRRVPVGKGRS